ncbi:hypothetical protein GQ457_18G007080 [Hibiscus cannabinus]
MLWPSLCIGPQPGNEALASPILETDPLHHGRRFSPLQRHALQLRRFILTPSLPFSLQSCSTLVLSVASPRGNLDSVFVYLWQEPRVHSRMAARGVNGVRGDVQPSLGFKERYSVALPNFENPAPYGPTCPITQFFNPDGHLILGPYPASLAGRLAQVYKASVVKWATDWTLGSTLSASFWTSMTLSVIPSSLFCETFRSCSLFTPSYLYGYGTLSLPTASATTLLLRLLLTANSLFICSLMDPELLSAMGNLQFTEEESATVVTETAATTTDEGICSWLVGSVITATAVNGDSVIQIFRSVWKAKNVSEIVELWPNFFLIKPTSAEATCLILKWRPWVVHGDLFSVEAYNPT